MKSTHGLRDVVSAEAKRRAAFLPGDEPADVMPSRARLALEPEGLPQDLRVERAGQPAVAGERQDPHRPNVLALLEEGKPREGVARAVVIMSSRMRSA